MPCWYGGVVVVVVVDDDDDDDGDEDVVVVVVVLCLIIAPIRVLATFSYDITTHSSPKAHSSS
jgi:hypothetical protein